MTYSTQALAELAGIHPQKAWRLARFLFGQHPGTGRSMTLNRNELLVAAAVSRVVNLQWATYEKLRIPAQLLMEQLERNPDTEYFALGYRPTNGEHAVVFTSDDILDLVHRGFTVTVVTL